MGGSSGVWRNLERGQTADIRLGTEADHEDQGFAGLRMRELPVFETGQGG
jgi:hypothetical protein